MALQLYKHGGDTVPALERCSDLLSTLGCAVVEKFGSFSFEDAVRIINDDWGELFFDEDALEGDDVPQCTKDIAQEFSIPANTCCDGYGLVFTDSEDDFYNWLESLGDCNVVCTGEFIIHRDRPVEFSGSMFDVIDIDDEVDAEELPVLSHDFARLIDYNGEVHAKGWADKSEFNENELSAEEWKFVNGFFGLNDEYDYGDFDELSYCFKEGERYVVEDEEVAFIVIPRIRW